jgi:hypothetical protein
MQDALNAVIMPDHVTESSDREGRISGHNKPSNDNLRIRFSGWMVALIFVLIGMTAAYIMSRR